jgi:hypothetical protein
LLAPILPDDVGLKMDFDFGSHGRLPDMDSYLDA